jgi:hypothetical protein
MSKLKIFLGGKIDTNDDWREIAKNVLERHNAEIIDPSPQLAKLSDIHPEYIQYDLAMLKKSDIALVNYDLCVTSRLFIEIANAKDKYNIPVIVFGTHLDSIIDYTYASRTFDTFTEAINHIIENYLIE